MASGFSTYLKNKIITDNFSNSGKFVALFTDAAGATSQPTAEANGTNCPGYARQPLTINTSGVGTTAQTFTATGAWATIRYAAIFDAVTGGNMLTWDEVTAETLANTNQLSFAAGQITVVINNAT